MGSQYTSLLHSVNFGNPSWDAFIFFFWIAGGIIYSFASGRGRSMSILVAVYMSELLVIQAPFLSTALGQQFGGIVYLSRLITFLVLFGLFFMILSRFVFRTAVDSRGITSWFFALVFAFLQVGFLISVILSFLPQDIKDSFAPLVKFIFLNSTAQFVWLLLPIAFLIVVGRHISDHNKNEW